MELDRPNTLHFATKGCGKISEKDILEKIKETVDKKDIHAIQVTQDECRITLKTKETKMKLKHEGVNLSGRFICLVDCDKSITNVTIKDAPFEMDDIVISSALSTYGVVIQNSVKRGKIKGTEIETGTRYLSMTNVEEVIPLEIAAGKYNLRVFCDNNKSRCIHCTLTSHPSYACPSKIPKKRQCYKCFSEDHIARDCSNDIVCNFCGISGHKERLCEEKKKQQYGEYYGEINEEAEAAMRNLEDDSLHANTHELGITEEESEAETKVATGVSIEMDMNNVLIIGDSNLNELTLKDDNFHLVQKSGASYEKIGELLDEAKKEHFEKPVDYVIVHLGTNDLMRSREDTAIVQINMIEGAKKISECFPTGNIILSSVLPRKGKSLSIQEYNNNIKEVNNFMEKLCKITEKMHCLNNSEAFAPNDNVKRRLFNVKDDSGIHINAEGKEILGNTFQNFVLGSEELKKTKKRARSIGEPTPPSAGKKDNKKNQTGQQS